MKKIFSRNSSPEFPWEILTDIEQLSRVDELSEIGPVLIFKHSFRCSISSMAKNRIENQWDFSQLKIPVFLVDVVGDRDVSNGIAQKFDVQHQSPQAILIHNKKPIYDVSHSAIDFGSIRATLQ